MANAVRPELCIRGRIKTGMMQSHASYVLLYADHMTFCSVNKTDIRALKHHIRMRLREAHAGLLQRQVLIDECMAEYGATMSGGDGAGMSLRYTEMTKLIYEPKAEAVNGEMDWSVPGKLVIEANGETIMVYHHCEPGGVSEQQLCRLCGQKLKSRFIVKNRRTG